MHGGTEWIAREKAIKELMLALFYFFIYRFKLEDLNEFGNRIKCDL